MWQRFGRRILICVIPLVFSAFVTAWAVLNYYSDEPGSGPRFNMGVDLAGGTILVYEVDRDWWNNLQPLERQNFDSASLAAALKRRIDPNNLLEVTVRPIDTTPPRVEIILPMRSARGGIRGSADIEQVKSLITQVGKLEFRMLADSRDFRSQQELEAFRRRLEAFVKDYVPDKRNVPPTPDEEQYQWMELAESEVKERGWGPDKAGLEQLGTLFFYHDPKYKRHFVLTKVPQPQETVTGEDLASARPDVGPQMEWVVRFDLKASGAERFFELTRPGLLPEEQKRFMAIILDGKVVSYPRLNDRLRDGGIITLGRHNPQELKRKVDQLVLILRSGALPATLNRQPVSEMSMGPGLGQDTIRKGTTAVVVGFVLVVLFMLVYYRFAGLVASVALLANLLLTVAFMVLVQATFTLPGLAGLVLMLAMAVDANVLIYERIREERERGASLVLAIRNGYDRAFPTIIDTHLTSIFTAVVLYAVGNDQLKGFGISLTVGLVISLFTALYMTRLIFDIWIARNWLKHLRMLKLLSRPNLDFMKYRYYWFTATVAAAVLGLVIFVLRGESSLNIDFTGGTAYSIEFRQPKRIEEIRARIAQPLPDGRQLRDPSVDAIYPAGEVAGETKTFTIRSTDRDVLRVRDLVKELFGQELVWIEVKVVPKTGAGTPPAWELHFSEPVAASLVEREVDAYWEKQGQRNPREMYRLEPLDPSDASGLHARFLLTLSGGVEQPVSDGQGLAQYLEKALHQPKSPRLENFDSQLARETQGRAVAAIALSCLAICLYLWFRFGSWTFGLAAVLCLIDDVAFAMGLVAICHFFADTWVGKALLLDDFKLDLAAVASLLTLVGYSVNDTIVVFDRIREVRGRSPVLTAQMINDSINQTLSRTLLTSFTVWLVVTVLYILGGQGIHLFSFIMMVGVIVGTYSSIFVASPLLLVFGEGRGRTEATPAKVQVRPVQA
ncbi:MAG: hypothetical protein C4297_07655 [Gemmataceae bacterium]